MASRNNRNTRIVRRRLRQRASDILTRFTRIFSNIFNRPLALILISIALILFTSRLSSKNNSLYSQALKRVFPNNTAPEFLQKNEIQSISFIGYSGIVLGTAPQALTTAYIAVAGVLAYLIPESSKWEYLIQGIFFALFISLRRPSDRVVTCILAVLAYASGFIFSSLSTAK